VHAELMKPATLIAQEPILWNSISDKKIPTNLIPVGCNSGYKL
jgi:hypothetical protein